MGKSKLTTSDLAAREIIENDFSRTLAVNAGAGSGKTHQMVERIVNGVRDRHFTMDRVAVITFTRKAAGEMRQRVIQRLNQLLPEAGKDERDLLEEQLVQAVTAQISTIHSFCASMLKEKPVEAGIDPAFVMLDDNDTSFFDDVFDRYRERVLIEEENGIPARVIEALLLDHGFELLTPEWSRGNVASVRDLLQTFITYRDASLAMPEFVDLEEELEKIRCFWDHCVAEADPSESLTNKLQELREDFMDIKHDPDMVKSFTMKMGNCGGKNWKEFRDKVKEEFLPLRHRYFYGLRYTTLKDLYDDLQVLFEDFIRFYRDCQVREGVMDNEDLLILARNLVRDNPEVRRYFRRRYRRLFVDEFQDTDPVQTELVFLLAGEESDISTNWQDVKLEKGKLFIIGDVKQAIYNFRRADVRSFMSALERVGPENTLTLSANFRSNQKVLDFVNGHFSTTMTRQNQYIPVFEPLEVTGDRRDTGKENRVISVTTNVEGTLSMDELRDLQSRLACAWALRNHGTRFDRWSDLTMLVRQRKAASRLMDALESAGIPCEISGSTSYFARYEVRHLATVLNAVVDPTDNISLYGALKGPFFGHTDRDIRDYLVGNRLSMFNADPSFEVGASLEFLGSLHRQSLNSRAEHVVNDLYVETGVLQGLAPGYMGREKVMNLLKALEFVRHRGSGSLEEAARELGSAIDSGMEMGDLSPAPGERDAVQVMTIHRAKGLENRVVYIVDAANMPFTRPTTLVHDNSIYLVHDSLKLLEYDAVLGLNQEKERAEEERLRYVAATRAADYLVFNRLNVELKSRQIEDSFIFPYYASLDGDNVDEEIIEIDHGMFSMPANYYPQVTPGNNKKLAKEAAAWRAKLDGAIERGGVPVFSVINPSSYRPGLSEGLEVEISADGIDRVMIENRLDAPAIGTVIHRLLEVGDRLDNEQIENYAAMLLEREGVSTAHADIMGIFRAITASHLYKRSLQAENVYRELPLVFAHNGGLVHGIVDLLFREGSTWVLVDYKVLMDPAGNSEESLKEKYAAQIELYAAGLSRLGIEVGEMKLLVG